MVTYSLRRIIGPLVLLCGLMQAVAGMAQAHIKRTYYDYQGRQFHEEYQYVSTATNRFSKQGYYKEYNEDGTLLRKGSYRNNKAEGRQLTYFTSDGDTWLEYDMMVHNNLRNGPCIKYAGPGDKLSSGNYVNGERAGRWIEYGSDKSQSATYYSHDEPYTGTAEERFANGKLRRSVQYYNGMRSGRTQTWYPNGNVKSEADYHNDHPDGPAFNYLEDGTPDAATAIFLAEQDAQTLAERADSTKQANEAIVALRQQVVQQHRQDSVRRINEHNWQVAATKRDEDRKHKTAEILLATAQAKQAALVRSEDISASENPTNLAGSTPNTSGLAASRRKPQQKLYLDLYAKLLRECQTTPGPDAQILQAQRLLNLMTLAEALYRGEQADLGKAIRKENDLNKLLALTGL